MSSNVREFDLALEEFGATEVPELAGRLHRAVALASLTSIVRMTPVDTGRARGNWQVTHDTPASGTVETTDKRGGGTIAKGSTAIAAIEPFEVTWITNNLPYIESLEKGHSRQAPAGMVAVTVARLQSKRRFNLGD